MGRACPRTTYDLSDTVSIWLGNHSIKTGASFTYDVTEQLYQPLQNGVYSLHRRPRGGAEAVPVSASRSRWFRKRG